jgi:hypothetical protein
VNGGALFYDVRYCYSRWMTRISAVATDQPECETVYEPCQRCAQCKGSAHPASGCQYSSRTLICGPCTRQAWKWVREHVNGKGGRSGVFFYDHVKGIRNG